MPHRCPGCLLDLLHAAAQGRRDLPLSAFPEAQIDWAIETGLGPLLTYTTAAAAPEVTSPQEPILQAAELTARLLTAEALDAMEEMLDACAGHVPPLTLLKGISIATQYYPRPHLRPMRDLDVLVEQEAVARVEAVLRSLGYRQQAGQPLRTFGTHHHGIPFLHPVRGLWVEVHWGLFPPRIPVGADRVFSLDHVRSQCQPSSFRGRAVMRLSPELQIVYIAAHWARDLRRIGGLVAMLDVLYLLRQTGAMVRWDQLLTWLEGSAAAISITLLFTYLVRAGLIDLAPDLLRDLWRTQHSFNRATLSLWHRFLDRHLVMGGPQGMAVYPLRLSGPPVRSLWQVSWALLTAWRVRNGLLKSHLLQYLRF